MKTLVIVPAYNEENNIVSVVEKIKALKYDYVVINDCSIDRTKEVVAEHDINCINLQKNIGISGVTVKGFEYARKHGYDCVVCVDGDGQHQPMYVPDLEKAIEKGNDYAIGSRYVTEKKPYNPRMIGSRVLVFLIRLKTGRTINDPTSGMRAVGDTVIDEFLERTHFHAEPDGVCYLLRKGYKVKEVQVKMLERNDGRSYFIKPWNAIKFMFINITSILFMR